MMLCLAAPRDADKAVAIVYPVCASVNNVALALISSTRVTYAITSEPLESRTEAVLQSGESLML